MSIVMMVNEKFRQNLLSIWEPFHERKEQFVPFFKRVLSLNADKKTESGEDMLLSERMECVLRLVYAF